MKWVSPLNSQAHIDISLVKLFGSTYNSSSYTNCFLSAKTVELSRITKMRKVYIAAAFRQFSNRENATQAYGRVVDDQYINFLEHIEGIFLAHGFYTCLPHRDEGGWGRVYYEPDAISGLCYRHVATSDVVFAIMEGG